MVRIVGKRTLTEEGLHLAGLLLAHTEQTGDCVRRGPLGREFRVRFPDAPLPAGELRARQVAQYNKKTVKITDRSYMLSLVRWTLEANA